MKLTKPQIKALKAFYKKNRIYSFGGFYYDRPVVDLDVFDNKVWITQKCETGRNIGVHFSCEGDTETIGCWAGAGWVLFGKKWIESLVKEIKAIIPSFTDYDNLKFEPTCVRMKQ